MNSIIVTVDSLFIVASIACEGTEFWVLFCGAVLSIISKFAIIFMRKRELTVLLSLSS